MAPLWAPAGLGQATMREPSRVAGGPHVIPPQRRRDAVAAALRAAPDAALSRLLGDGAHAAAAAVAICVLVSGRVRMPLRAHSPPHKR